jgi:hypothetical protein
MNLSASCIPAGSSVLQRAESLSSIPEFYVHRGRRLMRPAAVVVGSSTRLVPYRSRASKHHDKYDEACCRDDSGSRES